MQVFLQKNNRALAAKTYMRDFRSCTHNFARTL